MNAAGITELTACWYCYMYKSAAHVSFTFCEEKMPTCPVPDFNNSSEKEELLFTTNL